MSRYLFLFTISPVQSFIAQARKTQDLYSGSRLLSHLIETAINELPQHSEIIFPSKNTESKPNRFLAVVDTENIQKMGDDLKKIVQDKFIEISKAEMKGEYPANFDKQIESFLQIQWVAIEHDESQYKENYKDIERILGGVKNVRQFSQLEEEGNRKCSLCGERNALFYKPVIKEDGTKKKPAYLQNDAIEIENFDHGEGLCAVCFTKRFYEKGEFPSTAKIALMDTLYQLEIISYENYVLLDRFKKNVDPFNDQLFFEENLNESYFRKHDLKIKLLSCIKEKQKEIEKRAKQNDLRLKLSKYYAVIAFDGDSMGKWLSGEKLNDTAGLKAFHTALSEKLGAFAEYAKNYLAEPRGKTVYAGGDDFLGFVSLKHLFDVAKTLREKFDEQVNQPLEEFKLTGENLTFSAGIAVAHYKTPLSIVLDWARKMEKEAKNIDDNKDAFAIAVLKHSGEIHKTACKWKKDGCEPLAVIGNLVEVLAEDVFSNTFIKNLDSEFRRLMDKDGKFAEKHLIETEIKRLVSRSCMVKREAGEPKKNFETRKQEEISELSNSLCNLLQISKTLENFLSALHIADFIKREICA